LAGSQNAVVAVLNPYHHSSLYIVFRTWIWI